MTAFVAHWRALKAAADSTAGGADRSPADRDLLRAMDQLLGALDDRERTALELPAEAENSAELRRRERAVIKLTPILVAAGWLQ
jgi:hypothetical protein